MITWVRKPDSSDVSDPAPPAGSGRLTSLQFVREIVKRGANVNLRLRQRRAEGTPTRPRASSTEGATPFLFAADRSDIPLMRLLLELGADPLLPNFNNTTPLMAAAGLGTTEPLEEAGEEAEALEAVKMLLDLGADINAVDNNGDTPMHGAAYNNYPLVVKLLAERGADPQIWKKPNKFGRTPLFIAEGYHRAAPASRCTDDRSRDEADARGGPFDRRRTAADRRYLREARRATSEAGQAREALARRFQKRRRGDLRPLEHVDPTQPVCDRVPLVVASTRRRSTLSAATLATLNGGASSQRSVIMVGRFVKRE